MNEIVPVGILTDNAQASISFYRKVLNIHRVQLVKNPVSETSTMTLLRLESPSIEVNSTEVLIRDRQQSNFFSTSQQLRLRCANIELLKEKLLERRIQTIENNGKLSFLDPNGINWDLTPFN
jgi:catechol 2,3-dioxygenase-like lactoylglutathione lyase family enzyme